MNFMQQKPAAMPLKQLKRPSRRTLVRWNADLDQSLLLFIVSVCRRKGIQIPFDQVAREMGNAFTQGAIVQHIEKLRKQMEQLDIVPVPGGARRGISSLNKGGRDAEEARTMEQSPDSLPEENENDQPNETSFGYRNTAGQPQLDTPSSQFGAQKMRRQPKKVLKRKHKSAEAEPIIISDDESASVGEMKRDEAADEEIDRGLFNPLLQHGARFGANEYGEDNDSQGAFYPGTADQDMPYSAPPSTQKTYRRVRMMEVEEEWSEIVHN